MLATLRRGLVLGAAAMGLLLPLATAAFADSISFNLTAPDAAIASYPGPYANVTISVPNGGGNATVTWTADPGFLLGGAGAFDLNTVAGATIVGGTGGIALTDLPGFSSTVTSLGSGTVDGDGNFDLTQKFFDGYTGAAAGGSFVLAPSSGTFADASSVLAPDSSGFLAAGHVFVCDANPCSATGSATATGYAGNGALLDSAPEPGSLLLAGSGLAGLLPLVLRRRRTAA